MSKEYIITMTAGNRTGILSAVTKAMAELGADLREADSLGCVVPESGVPESDGT